MTWPSMSSDLNRVVQHEECFREKSCATEPRKSQKKKNVCRTFQNISLCSTCVLCAKKDEVIKKVVDKRSDLNFLNKKEYV